MQCSLPLRLLLILIWFLDTSLLMRSLASLSRKHRNKNWLYIYVLWIHGIELTWMEQIRSIPLFRKVYLHEAISVRVCYMNGHENISSLFVYRYDVYTDHCYLHDCSLVCLLPIGPQNTLATWCMLPFSFSPAALNTLNNWGSQFVW